MNCEQIIWLSKQLPVSYRSNKIQNMLYLFVFFPVVTGIEVMVRTCTLENMGQQCGVFRFDGDMYKGCLSTCIGDACNSATKQSDHSCGQLLVTSALVLFHIFRDWCIPWT